MRLKDFLREADDEGRLETRTVDSIGNDDTPDDFDNETQDFDEPLEGEEADDDSFNMDDTSSDISSGDANSIWASVSNHDFVQKYKTSSNPKYDPAKIVALPKTELTQLQDEVWTKLRSISKPVGNNKNITYKYLSSALSFIETVLQKTP